MSGRVLTIDGPSGAGKSTVARAVAARLGWRFLDTGAMYRAVALAALRRGIDLDDEAALASLVSTLELTFDGERVSLDGEDVTAAIRTPEVAAASSRVARCPAVRARLGEWQRRFAENGMIVTEGRDQGTVVFPRAECKVFLTASPEERAARRHAELTARGTPVDRDQVVREQRERDERDSQRAVAPLRPAPDALIVETTGLSVEDVIALIVARVEPGLGDDPLDRLAVAWSPDRTRLVAVGRSIDDVTRAVVLGPEECIITTPGQDRPA